jgi:hypothetical protein
MSEAEVLKSFIDGMLFAIIGYVIVQAVQNWVWK